MSCEEGGNGNSITQKEYGLYAPYPASTVVEMVEITTLQKCISFIKAVEIQMLHTAPKAISDKITIDQLTTLQMFIGV